MLKSLVFASTVPLERQFVPPFFAGAVPFIAAYLKYSFCNFTHRWLLISCFVDCQIAEISVMADRVYKVSLVCTTVCLLFTGIQSVLFDYTTLPEI